MHSLQQQTLNNIKRNNLLRKGEKVIVAVSSGADSVCLLHVLSFLKDTIDISLVAAYIDHGLRPMETGKERLLVKSLAEALAVDFESVEIDVNSFVKEKKLSIEHAARELRYEALRKIAADTSAAAIAVAHTADDQAEEILIRLLRGSGRKGVSGMRSRQGDIVRPLLEIEKQDIVSYLNYNNINFLEDSSNADTRFLRNRVRHELIPFLEEKFDPGIKPALLKTAESLAEDEDLLEELTEIAWELVNKKISQDEKSPDMRILIGRKSFKKQPAALQRRIIERLLWKIGSKAGYNHILQVVEAAKKGRTGSELHLSKGLRVGVQREYVEFLYPKGQGAWRGRLYPV